MDTVFCNWSAPVKTCRSLFEDTITDSFGHFVKVSLAQHKKDYKQNTYKN